MQSNLLFEEPTDISIDSSNYAYLELLILIDPKPKIRDYNWRLKVWGLENCGKEKEHVV